MKKIKNRFVLIVLFLICADLFAQQNIVIEGTVVDDDNTSMQYVNVYILNTNVGTTTDSDGRFRFTAAINGDAIISASMIGYSKYEKKLIGQQTQNITLNIILKKELIQLQESIVVGSSFGSEKGKGVVLSSTDVYNTPGGAADIFQSLKTLPGLTQVSESAQLFVRGGDPIETLTMVDGATLYHPYTYESANGGLFSNLNTSIVKGLYFSSGGFSTKYGDVLSGVLDIETKDEPTDMNYLMGISMASSSLIGEIPIVDGKLGIRFALQESYTKPIMWFNGALDEFTTSPSSSDYSLSTIYRYSKKGKIKVFGLYAKDNQGVNIDRAEYDGVFNGNSTNNLFNLHQTHILASNILIKNSLSYSSHSNYWSLGILDFTQTDDVLKLRSDVEYQLTNNLKLISGFEFEKRKREYKGIVPEEDFDLRPEALGTNIDVSVGIYRVGGYGEVELTDIFGIENLFAVTGLRYDSFPDLKVNWFDPRAGFGYKLSSASTIKLAAGVFHQLPDLRLFSADDGNPNLVAMKAEHLVVSYDLAIDKNSSIRVEGYHKKYSNLPLENDLTNYSNDGEGFAKGVDFILKGKFPLGFDGWISYGYINTKRKWLDYENLSKSDFDITHNLAIVMNYRISAMWRVGINYKYATGRPYTPVVSSEINSSSGIYQPIYGLDNSDRFPDYHRLDFRVTHFNQIFGKLYTVFYVEALNILDITNLFGYSYSQDYSERYRIKSYFGRRTIVFGAQISF